MDLCEEYGEKILHIETLEYKIKMMKKELEAGSDQLSERDARHRIASIKEELLSNENKEDMLQQTHKTTSM